MRSSKVIFKLSSCNLCCPKTQSSLSHCYYRRVKYSQTRRCCYLLFQTATLHLAHALAFSVDPKIYATCSLCCLNHNYKKWTCKNRSHQHPSRNSEVLIATAFYSDDWEDYRDVNKLSAEWLQMHHHGQLYQNKISY